MDHDIEKLLKATIQTKVVEAFNSTPEMVDKLVEAAFQKEVDQDGRPSASSYSRDKMPWLEWLVGEEIRRATLDIMREYVAEHKDTIRAKVRQSIATADIGTPLAAKVADIFADQCRWKIQLDLTDD